MILVTGATGYIGSAVLRRLASYGCDVAAMVRDAEAARDRLPAGTAMRIADYEDMAALGEAFAGIDELLLISSDGDAGSVLRHHANAIETAAKAGVRHIAFTSIVDVGEGSPFYFAPVYRDAEHRLAQCGVPATILRCGLYSDFILDYWLEPSQASGELSLPAGDGLVAPVSRDDVAMAIAAIAADPAKSGATYSITGDQAQDFNGIASSYAQAIGKELHYRPCSVDDYLDSAGKCLEHPWPEAFATLSASICEGRYVQPSSDFAAITGRKPERFADFLRRATSGGSAL